MIYVAAGVLWIVFFLLISRSLQAQIETSSRAEIEGAIKQTSSLWGMNPALTKAIVRKESDFNPRAKNPADPSYGLCAITPRLAFDFELITDWKSPSAAEIEKIYNVQNNLNCCCWNMVRLLRSYSFDTAVQMHNVGESGYNSGHRVPDYLEAVKSFYNEYKKES